MASRYFLIIICSLFLAAGTTSTLATKWSDLLDAPDNNGVWSSFEHPFFQTLVMFFGETICFGAFHSVLWKKQKDNQQLVVGDDYSLPMNRLLFSLPAIADFTATTLNNVALSLTSASVYQMLRGSIVLFTGLFSYIFLKRRFFRHEYLGMGVVIVGLTIVGVSASMKASSSAAKNPALGNILVVVAQVIQSSQFVIEEALLKKYRVPPLYMVGWEGIIGGGMTLIVLAVFQAFNGEPDNVVVALEQISNCWRCAIATLVVLCAIPIFNGAAVTITKELSAASRMILDALRNITVWTFTMSYSSYFHESFDWLQLVGFVFLVSGSLFYREIVKIPHPFFYRPMENVLDGPSYAALTTTEDSQRRNTEMIETAAPQQRDSIAANL